MHNKKTFEFPDHKNKEPYTSLLSTLIVSTILYLDNDRIF